MAGVFFFFCFIHSFSSEFSYVCFKAQLINHIFLLGTWHFVHKEMTVLLLITSDKMIKYKTCGHIQRYTHAHTVRDQEISIGQDLN